MGRHIRSFFTLVICSSAFARGPLPAQMSRADYDRAANMRDQLAPLALNLPGRPSWIGDTSRFWYRKTVRGGFDFVVVDAATLQKRPAFDAEKLAAALAEARKERVDPRKLPFESITFVDDGRAVQFDVEEERWQCDLASYSVRRAGNAERQRRSRDPMSVWERDPAPQAASTEWNLDD